MFWFWGSAPPFKNQLESSYKYVGLRELKSHSISADELQKGHPFKVNPPLMGEGWISPP